MENIVGVSCSWPCIVLVGGQDLKNQVLCDVLSDPKIVNITIPIPDLIAKRSALISTNIDGWFLVLPSSSNQPCLWNPVTLVSIDLPLIEPLAENRTSYVFLTASPNDCSCVVFLFDISLNIRFCFVNGGSDWTYMDGQELPRDKVICPIAIDDDKTIMISYLFTVAKIEIVEPKKLALRTYFYYERPQFHVCTPLFASHEYLVACCGDLYVIYLTSGHMFNQILSIEVFKLDFSDMSWERISSCPNVAFFLMKFCGGNQQGFAYPIASTDSNKIGNRVYIIDKDDEGEETDEDVRILLRTYHIQKKTLITTLIATTNNEVEPYWILVSNDQVAAKAKHNYSNEGDVKNDHLFANLENTELMTIHNDYENEKKFFMELENLPIDILKIISSNLTYLLDYLNFRASSRFFHDNFSINEWWNMRASERYTRQSPWLIFPKSQQVGKCVFSMVDPISRNKNNVRTPETIEENSKICYSANGWLLISSAYYEEDVDVNGFNMLFYNPITQSTISLPKLPTYYAWHFLFTGSPDYEESCIVLGVSRYMNIDIEHGYHPAFYFTSKESGKDEWEEWDWEELTVGYEDENSVQQSNVNVVYIGDVFYFLAGDGKVIYISYEHETLGIHSLAEPCSKSSYEQCFLVEFDQVLHSIYIGKEGKWLRVFKFNESNMIWDEVKELKGKNLYLSNVSSTFLKPQSPDIGNKIYFSRFYQNSIVYYSFETNQFHLNDGKGSVMTDYYGSEEQMCSCWF